MARRRTTYCSLMQHQPWWFPRTAAGPSSRNSSGTGLIGCFGPRRLAPRLLSRTFVGNEVVVTGESPFHVAVWPREVAPFAVGELRLDLAVVGEASQSYLPCWKDAPATVWVFPFASTDLKAANWSTLQLRAGEIDRDAAAVRAVRPPSGWRHMLRATSDLSGRACPELRGIWVTIHGGL
jgi:hypothetical protein